MNEKTTEKNEKNQKKENKLRITPDTTTVAWKKNLFRQENTNKNVCIYQGGGDYECLCSAQDLVCEGECVFTIKVLKVTQYDFEASKIWIGVMESKMKGEEWLNTKNYFMYLHPPFQKIWKPNEEQTDWETVDCSCQQSLQPVPCLIQCHVNRQSNTIAWNYNGKKQAQQRMPQFWKDGRKLCAVLLIWNKDDCVEFM